MRSKNSSRNSNRAKSKKEVQAIGSIRIIAGAWRSRKINVIDQEGLRPTTNRIKETVFNWLQMHLPGSNVLDLFAGTGSLGLEALSRGAQFCHFNEISSGASKMLVQNIETLNATEQSSVSAKDAKMLLSESCEKPMDLVFLDPPFDLDIYEECFVLLQENNWVQSGSLIYCESAKRKTLEFPESWEIIKEKVAGQVCSRLIRVS